MNQCLCYMWPRCWFNRLGFLVALSTILPSATQAAAENQKSALPERPHWTVSRVVGSPEPPPPYTVEPVFTHIKWKNPVFAIREPESEWLIVIEWPQTIAAPVEANSQANDKHQLPRFTPARVVRVLDRVGDQPSQPFLELK